MYDNLLDYLLWIRRCLPWDRSPGISNEQLDDFIKQIKGSDPIWEIMREYKDEDSEYTCSLNPMYISVPSLSDAIRKTDDSRCYDGRIYME